MDWFTIAFISALFSAAAAIAQKKILFDLSALDFSLLLSLFNFIFSLPFFLSVDFSLITSNALLVLFIKNILGAFAFLCVMLSIKNLEISKALPLLALTPGFVAIFAFLTIHDSLTSPGVLGIFLLLAGTYLLESKPKQKIFEPFRVFYKSKNYNYIIIALTLLTVTSVLDRFLLNKSQYILQPDAFMAFQHFFLAVDFLIVYFIWKGNVIKLIKSTSKNDLWWVVLISILTLSYRYTQIEATKIAPVALVLSVKRFSVFFAALIGGKIFKEERLIIKAAATAIIIIGAILISGY
jgi:drug/metabolite transporter (DMT)-like permease